MTAASLLVPLSPPGASLPRPGQGAGASDVAGLFALLLAGAQRTHGSIMADALPGQANIATDAPASRAAFPPAQAGVGAPKNGNRIGHADADASGHGRCRTGDGGHPDLSRSRRRSALGSNWLEARGPNDSSIALHLGTIGTADGLSQFSSDYNVTFVIQNGAEVGELNGVTIDAEGFVIASFTNGTTRKIYKLPVATFANPLALDPRTGNVYGQTAASGAARRRPGRGRRDRAVLARRSQRRSGRGVHQNVRDTARLFSQCARHHNDR